MECLIVKNGGLVRKGTDIHGRVVPNPNEFLSFLSQRYSKYVHPQVNKLFNLSTMFHLFSHSF